MPAADSITSPEASRKKGAKSQGLSSWESDLSIWLHKLVTEAMVEAELAIEAEVDAASLAKRLAGLMADTKPVPRTDISSADAPGRGQKNLAYRQAELTFDNASDAASAALRTALGAWTAAIRAYGFAKAQADEQLEQARHAATKAYVSFMAAVLPDNIEHSACSYQYFTNWLAIAVAIQAHTASAAAAADELAGAAGVLIGAAQTYKDQIKAAQAQRNIDEATADQTFWQNYESSTA